MTSKEIEQNLEKVILNLNPEEFIYEFLLSFGISKTTISRLKKGDFNKSKIEGELLYSGKVFFKTGEAGSMLYDIETLAKEERILKQNPRFIILTDFENFVTKDLKTGHSKEFPINELPKYYSFFLPLTGAEIYKSSNDNKADRDASYELAKLYDILIEDNAELLNGNSHSLNIFLSRILFCFFAEDTGVFETEGIFSDSLANHTKEDGSDVHVFLTDLFYRLNTKEGNFPSYVADFPYVNGGLFNDVIECPKFSRKSREILLNCGNLNWDEINPDIFGSMIQAVADPEERSDLGMHYTSVPNILKLIKPLFLDELYEDFENNRDKPKKLEQLLLRLSKIKFFDPACGSGNFLIITYKEIRLLEINIIKRLIEIENEMVEESTMVQSQMDFSGKNDGVRVKPTQKKISFGGTQRKIYFSQIQLSQFYGIEIKDFAHEMAILSLWLAEHQMNKVFEDQLEDYGQVNPILPLKKSGNITHGNAARTDWNIACPKAEGDEIYIIGNPPYLGSSMQDREQKEDMSFVFRKFKDFKNLDYVSIWFFKGAEYILGNNSKLAFVSTNSICQGEQVALLWPKVLNEDIEISFAYRSFKWINNAKANAGVTVVIIGLRNKSTKPKFIFIDKIKKEVKHINAYLIDYVDIYFYRNSESISDFPKLVRGSMPTDDGNFELTEEEMIKLTNDFPESQKLVKKYVSGGDFINGRFRYCLWIPDEELEFARSIPFINSRLEKVKEFRLKSDASTTVDYAIFPNRFRQISYKETEAIIVPLTSSDSRTYIPFGFVTSEYVVTNSAGVIYNAEPWLFGILNSKMHMVWVDAVGGKLKTDYRYSTNLCYNNFPFPKISEKDKQNISEYVYTVLDERAKFPEKTMAWLYNPETMPKGLKQAHHELDLAIERIYRLRPFESDAERLEFLFKMYDEMTKKDSLFAKEKKKKIKK